MKRPALKRKPPCSPRERLGHSIGDALALAITVALWETFGPAGPIGYFALRCAIRHAARGA